VPPLTDAARDALRRIGARIVSEGHPALLWQIDDADLAGVADELTRAGLVGRSGGAHGLTEAGTRWILADRGLVAAFVAR
jgi:hypothetical protein